MIRGIKNKLMAVMAVSLAIAVLCIGGIGSYSTYSHGVQSSKDVLALFATAGSQRVSAEFAIPMVLAMELVGRVEFQDVAKNREEVINILKTTQRRNTTEANIIDVDYIDVHGKTLSGHDYSRLPAFIKVKQTLKPLYTDVMQYSKDASLNIFAYCAPVLKDEKFNGMVYIVISADYLQTLVKKLVFNDIGYAYIIDKNGTLLAYSKGDSHYRQRFNMFEAARKDAKYKDSAEVLAQMLQGERGEGVYRNIDGETVHAASVSLAGSANWTFVVAMSNSALNASILNSIYYVIILTVILLALVMVVAAILAQRIIDPIRQCAVRLQQLSAGDLTSPVPQGDPRDETGILSNATQTLVNDFRNIINNMSHVVGELSKGNLCVQPDATVYKGDLQPMYRSMQLITSSLNETFSQFSEATNQIAMGAEQVAMGAQSLSESAIQQAAAVQEVSASISNISQQVAKNSTYVESSGSRTMAFVDTLQRSRSDLQEVLQTMQTMVATSENIHNVVKTIEEIAFKTDILAINASIEAARTGTESKGFGVVASEVRKLASRSSDAAVNTNQLVQNTLVAIQESQNVAEQTAHTLEDIINDSAQLSEKSQEIIDYSREQACAIKEVNATIEQLASIAQNNSATAEESAASSEELSSQAAYMRELINRFTFRRG